MSKGVNPRDWNGSLYTQSDGSITSYPPAAPAGLGFPRTAGIFNGGDQTYAPTPYAGQTSGKVISSTGFFQESTPSNPVAWMGRFNIALIGGNYEGWTAGATLDRGLLVDAIQQMTNVSGYQPCCVWQYVDYDDRITSGVATKNAPEESFYPYIDSNKWLLYTGPNQTGSPVSNFFGNGNTTNWSVAWPGTVNGVAADQGISPGRMTSPFDGLKEDFLQAAAAYFCELYIARHTAFTGAVCGPIPASKYTDSRWYPNLVIGPNYDQMKAPNLGGIFVDNQFFYPRDTGYYDLASSYGASTSSPTTPWLARGHQHFKSRTSVLASACYPNRAPPYRVGNIGTLLYIWQASSSNFSAASNAISGYQDGGIWEAPSSSGFESSYGTAATIHAYQAAMDFCSGPKQIVVACYPSSLTDYQTARAWLGITLMDNGYFNATISSSGYSVSSNVWLDEVGGNPGTNIGKEWLGQPNGSRPTAAAISGCWVRDFTHGTVILNPRNNGSQTITAAQLNAFLGKSYSYSFFQGVQNPTLNSGAAMSSVTLNATSSVGDAVLLMH